MVQSTSVELASQCLLYQVCRIHSRNISVNPRNVEIMKFLADPRKRRQWVLILLKELFYVKSRARGDTLAFI